MVRLSSAVKYRELTSKLSYTHPLLCSLETIICACACAYVCVCCHGDAKDGGNNGILSVLRSRPPPLRLTSNLWRYPQPQSSLTIICMYSTLLLYANSPFINPVYSAYPNQCHGAVWSLEPIPVAIGWTGHHRGTDCHQKFCNSAHKNSKTWFKLLRGHLLLHLGKFLYTLICNFLMNLGLKANLSFCLKPIFMLRIITTMRAGFSRPHRPDGSVTRSFLTFPWLCSIYSRFMRKSSNPVEDLSLMHFCMKTLICRRFSFPWAVTLKKGILSELSHLQGYKSISWSYRR